MLLSHYKYFNLNRIENKVQKFQKISNFKLSINQTIDLTQYWQYIAIFGIFRR